MRKRINANQELISIARIRVVNRELVSNRAPILINLSVTGISTSIISSIIAIIYSCIDKEHKDTYILQGI